MHPSTIDQFHIPEQGTPTTLEQEIEGLFATMYSEQPDLRQEVLTSLRGIEADIVGLRAQAQPGVLRPRTFYQKILDSVGIGESIRGFDTWLVEQERQASSAFLPAHTEALPHRFWYHGGRWHYEIDYPEGSATAVYILRDQWIEKLVDGKPTAPEPGEEAALVALIPLYYDHMQKTVHQKAQQA